MVDDELPTVELWQPQRYAVDLLRECLRAVKSGSVAAYTAGEEVKLHSLDHVPVDYQLPVEGTPQKITFLQQFLARWSGVHDDVAHHLDGLIRNLAQQILYHPRVRAIQAVCDAKQPRENRDTVLVYGREQTG